jgi:S-DNA-T family DNA segregation ATPase FtsK/SpoIIIE
MAKKKKALRKKKSVKPTQSSQHDLPSGFWSQVGAVLLIAISLLFVVSWFKAGGPVLDWLYKMTQVGVGYSVYIIPVLFIYIAVEIFRAENNRLSFPMKLATILAIVWFSGLFGLLKNNSGQTTGGIIGDFLNKGTLVIVNSSVAAFVYVLLIVITLLFIIRVSPRTVIKKIWQLGRSDMSDQEANIKVMRNAAAIDGSSRSSIGNLKIISSVPLDSGGLSSDNKKQSRFSGLKGDIGRDKIGDEQALVTISDPNWKAPSIDLLEKKQSPADAGDIQQNALIIKNTLAEFDIDVEMEGANTGPRVTQFTLKPPSGVKLTRITALETNIALNLAAKSLRIEAPIPGKKAVGIEVPNIKAADVRLYSVLSSPYWEKETKPLSFAIGKDIAGGVIIGDLNKMPHLLIAGQTGSGKSVMINTLITSLLYRNSPSDLKLILVDPKQVEMSSYEDIPHLLTPIITEPDKMISALKWAVNEMQRRYSLMAENKVKTIEAYNNKIQTTRGRVSVADEDGILQEHENGAMPYIVIVIDELAELMMTAPKDVEALIVRLAQKARAIGIHLVLATQRPDANIITGLIKANVPAKIAFTVASQINSRIILDETGAEKLLGSGDMLFRTAEMGRPTRAQGAFVSDAEIHKINDYLRSQSPPQYNDEVVSQPVHLNGKGGVVMDFDSGNDDDLYKDAVRVVIDSNKASASLLQRRLRVGYARAARLIENMEDQGIIGPADGARSREVLISSFDEFGQTDDEI